MKNEKKMCTQTSQIGVTKKCNISQKQEKIKKKHQHNAEDGGQTLGEQMRHVQMSSDASIQVKEVSSNNDYEAEGKAF